MREILAALVVLALASPAHARKPKNPRRRPPTVAASTAAAVSAGLTSGRWQPEVAAAIASAAKSLGKDGDRFDPAAPPVAVMPLQDVLVRGDVAELAFQRLVRRADFKFDDGFWDIVPIAYGRQKIRAAYEQFSGLPSDIWDKQPAYHQYAKGFIKSYQDMCREMSRKDCRVYLARLWRGYDYSEAVAYAQKTMDEESAVALSTEAVRDSFDDPSPAFVRRGMRIIPEGGELARFLSEAGLEVMISDVVAEPVLDAAAARLGLAKARIAGIKQARFKERLTGQVVEPVPLRGGKIEAVVAPMGRAPALVVGASADDAALLGYGDGLRLVIGSKEPALRQLALRKKWLVQDGF